MNGYQQNSSLKIHRITQVFFMIIIIPCLILGFFSALVMYNSKLSGGHANLFGTYAIMVQNDNFYSPDTPQLKTGNYQMFKVVDAGALQPGDVIAYYSGKANKLINSTAPSWQPIPPKSTMGSSNDQPETDGKATISIAKVGNYKGTITGSNGQVYTCISYFDSNLSETENQDHNSLLLTVDIIGVAAPNSQIVMDFLVYSATFNGFLSFILAPAILLVIIQLISWACYKKYSTTVSANRKSQIYGAEDMGVSYYNVLQANQDEGKKTSKKEKQLLWDSARPMLSSKKEKRLRKKKQKTTPEDILSKYSSTSDNTISMRDIVKPAEKIAATPVETPATQPETTTGYLNSFGMQSFEPYMKKNKKAAKDTDFDIKPITNNEYIQHKNSNEQQQTDKMPNQKQKSFWGKFGKGKAEPGFGAEKFGQTDDAKRNDDRFMAQILAEQTGVNKASVQETQAPKAGFWNAQEQIKPPKKQKNQEEQLLEKYNQFNPNKESSAKTNLFVDDKPKRNEDKFAQQFSAEKIGVNKSNLSETQTAKTGFWSTTEQPKPHKQQKSLEEELLGKYAKSQPADESAELEGLFVNKKLKKSEDEFMKQILGEKHGHIKESTQKATTNTTTPQQSFWETPKEEQKPLKKQKGLEDLFGKYDKSQPTDESAGLEGLFVDKKLKKSEDEFMKQILGEKHGHIKESTQKTTTNTTTPQQGFWEAPKEEQKPLKKQKGLEDLFGKYDKNIETGGKAGTEKSLIENEILKSNEILMKSLSEKQKGTKQKPKETTNAFADLFVEKSKITTTPQQPKDTFSLDSLSKKSKRMAEKAQLAETGFSEKELSNAQNKYFDTITAKKTTFDQPQKSSKQEQTTEKPANTILNSAINNARTKEKTDAEILELRRKEMETIQDKQQKTQEREKSFMDSLLKKSQDAYLASIAKQARERRRKAEQQSKAKELAQLERSKPKIKPVMETQTQQQEQPNTTPLPKLNLKIPKAKSKFMPNERTDLDKYLAKYAKVKEPKKTFDDEKFLKATKYDLVSDIFGNDKQLSRREKRKKEKEEAKKAKEQARAELAKRFFDPNNKR